jgi:molecular chaperone GrpE
MNPRKKTEKPRDKPESPPTADMAGPETEAFEEPAVAPESPTPEEVVAALSDEIEELEDRYLRLVAEFDNFRKRTIRERAQQSDRAQAEVAKQLLESLDDMSRVSELGSTDHDAAAILEGVHLVEAKLRRTLEALGLKPIEAVGQPFNPELHDAMVTVPTDQLDEDGVISQEIARGYLFKDALLRPSRVLVKKYQPLEAGGETEGQS